MYHPPRSTTSIASNGQIVGDGGLLGLIFPAFKNDDCKPRLISTYGQFINTFGFGEGAAFAAWFMKQTKRAIVAMGVPVVTHSVVTPATLTGLSSTSVVTVAATANDHCRAETQGIVRVKTGGTVGTNQIVLEVSLDGGEVFKPIRLGKANSLVIPYYGLTLAFAAGTLVAGETVCKWSSTAPAGSVSADLADCMTALASDQFQLRSMYWLNEVGVLADAQALVQAMNDYESDVDRYPLMRINATDATTGEDWDEYAAARADLFETIDDQRRIDIGIGRCFIFCPITKYLHTRPAQWSVLVEEYIRPLGTSTFDASKGPLRDVSLYSATTKRKLYDERITKLACANRFTSLTTEANSRVKGAVYVALSLTRANDEDVLSLTHNVLVVNVVQTVCQSSTSLFRGTNPEVNADHTPTPRSIKFYEDSVNGTLEANLMLNKPGALVSSAVWRADPASILKGTGSKLNGRTFVEVNGTVLDVETNIMVG